MAPRGPTLRYVPMFKSKTVTLAAFVQNVGARSFGEQWKVARRFPALEQQVIEDVYCGLYSDDIEACVWLSVKRQDSEKQDKIEFLVDSGYWETQGLERLQSLLKARLHTIPSDYLFFHENKNRIYLKDRYVDPSIESHVLRIRDGRDVFPTDYSYISPEFLERYRVYSQHITTEMVAVAWRLLAIKGLIKKIELVEELEFYLRNQGLQDNELPSRDKISLIAGRVRQQLQRKDENSSILVSSNPKDRKVQI